MHCAAPVCLGDEGTKSTPCEYEEYPCRVPDGARRRWAVYLPRSARGGRDPCGSGRRLVHAKTAAGPTKPTRAAPRRVGRYRALASTRRLSCQAAKSDLRRMSGSMSDPVSGLLRRRTSFLFGPQPTQAESGSVVGIEVRARTLGSAASLSMRTRLLVAETRARAYGAGMQSNVPLFQPTFCTIAQLQRRFRKTSQRDRVCATPHRRIAGRPPDEHLRHRKRAMDV